MKRLMTIWFMALTLIALAGERELFKTPPHDCRPETWFHIIGGNVSSNGITADLTALHDAGFGGIQFFHGAGKQFPRTTSQTQCLSADWESYVRFIAEECERLGLTFMMQNCPGWSMAGGPWITHDTAMRDLAWVKAIVHKGNHAVVPLTERHAEADSDWRDIRVFAFPTVLGEGEELSKSFKGVEGRNLDVIEFTSDRPFTVRTVELSSVQAMCHARCYAPDVRVALQVERDSAWYEVGSWAMPQSTWQDDQPISLATTEVTAQKFRLKFVRGHDVLLTSAKLLGQARPHNWEASAGRCLRATMHDAEITNAPAAYVDATKIIDITDKLAEWVSPNDYTVVRLGHVNKRHRNAPAPPEATGWECDKLSAKGYEANYAGYVGRLVQKGGALEGKVRGLLLDSWECKAQTWTEGFDKEFARRNGYELWPQILTMLGYVTTSRADSEKFLLDLRRTYSKLMADNFYGTMRRLAKRDGLQVHYETAAGDVYPGDFLEYFKYADVPMCEFWQPRTPYFVGSLDFKPVRPTVSAAHLYGKRRIACESFTGGCSWDESPRFLKDIVNVHFAYGITHVVTHTMTHQPQTDADFIPPGSSFGSGIGTPFLRGQTWWPYMRGFTDYLARCNWMLERGRPVNDVLMYLGDEQGHKPPQRLVFAEGINYDYCSQDALLNRLTVKDGKWTTPEGITYSALWLHSSPYLLPETQQKIASGIKAGAKVCGDERLSLVPDVLGGGTNIVFQHRIDGDEDIYFVTAEGTNAWRGKLSFRSVRTPVTLWNPNDGSVVAAQAQVKDGRTEVDLQLAPSDACFVVLGSNAPVDEQSKVQHTTELNNLKWSLTMEGREYKLECLAPWRDVAQDNRVKSFSGIAVYRTTFECNGIAAELDLGRVEVAAAVRVNGHACGQRWSYPYTFNISGTIQKGVNTLEVEVVSTWFNRLTFEAALPEKERTTWTTKYPDKNSPLKPYGLLGPVVLREF